MLSFVNCLAIMIGLLLSGGEVTYMFVLVAIFPLAAKKREISEFWIGAIIGSVYYASFAFSLLWPLIIRQHHLTFAYKCAWLLLGTAFTLFSFNFEIGNKFLFIALCIIEGFLSGALASLLYITSIPVLTQIYPEKSGTIISAMQGFMFLAASIGSPIANSLYRLGGCFLPFICMGIFQVFLALWAIVLTPPYHGYRNDNTSNVSKLEFYKLISRPSVIFLSFPEGIVSMVIGMNCSTLSIYIKDTFHLDESNNFIIFLAHGLTVAFFAPLIGYTVDKGHATFIMVISIITFPFILMVFIYCKSLPMFIIAYCFQGATSGVISNISLLYFAKQAEKWELSNTKMLAATLTTTIRAFFRGVGATVFGGVLQEFFSIQTTWWLAFFTSIIVSVITLFEIFKQGYHRRIYYEVI